jgi:hypothetical protein
MSLLYSHCLHLFAFGDAIFSIPGSILFALVFFFPDWRVIYLSNWLDGHFRLVCWKLNNLSPTPVYYFLFWVFFPPQFQGSCYSRSIESTIGLDFLFSPPLYLSLPTSSRRKQNKEKKKNQFNSIWTGLCVCVGCCRLLGNPTVADKFAQSRRINPRHSWPYSNILLRWLCSIPCLVELITHSLKLFWGGKKIKAVPASASPQK